MASISELSAISQIVQLENQDIIVLDTKLGIISYVHLHDKTTEVLMCKGAGCCSAFGSEQCYQSHSSDIGGITVNLKEEHAWVYFSDKTTVKKFHFSSQHIQPEVVVDLVNHVGSTGKIVTFTFNKDYSIIFLLWERLDNEDRLLYRYNIHGKNISGEINMQEVALTEISSVNKNIILGLDVKHKQLVALDFESDKSISSWVCLVNATAGSPGYSDEDDNSLECNTDSHSIKMMTQDDNYIYAMDSSANSILAIDNIKGLYIKIDIAISPVPFERKHCQNKK